MLHKKKMTVAVLTLLLTMLPLGLMGHAKDNATKRGKEATETADSDDEHTDTPAFQYKKPSRTLKQNNKEMIPDADVSDKVYDRRVMIKTKEDSEVKPEKWNVEEVSVSQQMKSNHYMVVRIPGNEDYNEKLQQIAQDEAVELAEPDYIGEISKKAKANNGKHQWYTKKIGMKKAWDITEGSKDTTIAVLDSGVDDDHPALKNKLLPGYNFVNDNKNTADKIGHGTAVSGIIAAKTNKNKMTGIDTNARILPVKVSDNSGEVSGQNIVDGIHYAIDHDADVINMSYGSYKHSDIEEEAIADAYDAGITLVASSGNDGSDRASYPAAYPGVIGASSTGKKDKVSSFSNFGNYIDIAAPGESIYSAKAQGGYANVEGTSFSAPIVSGVAGLLQAEQPDWNQNQIAWALEDGAESPKKSEWTKKKGYGRIDAAQTLKTDLPDWSDDAPDKKKQAKDLEMFEEEQGKINYPMDVDWYKVHVKNKGRVTIDAKTSTDTLDLVMALDSPDKDDDRKFYDDGGKGDDERFSFQAEKGDYHIAVYDYNQHWSTSDYTLQVDGTKFSDVKEYQQEIETLEEKDIIRGFPDGTFKPRENVNRLQTVRMILKEQGVDPKTYDAPNPNFSDMTAAAKDYQTIAAAADLGIIKGMDDHTFDPYGHLTRGQMAAVITRAYDLDGSTDQEFKDVAKNHWAHDAVNTLAANDIAKGYSDHTYRPSKKISRQHFSKLLYRYLEQKK